MHTWTPDDFPVGFHTIHPEPSTNFQLNRLYHFSGSDQLLHDLQQASPHIHDLTSFPEALIPLAEEHERRGNLLEAAFCYRGAEFVIPSTDPHRTKWRRQFRELSNTHYAIPEEARSWVPFGSIGLSTLHLTPSGPSRGTLVLMNGFDGCLEEFTRIMLTFRDAGYEVIAFDGPGQGETLAIHGASMIPGWEHPTAAVLDHFDLDDVTVLGCSLGGGLAVRAAAFEPRIRRVICFDVLPDLFGSLSQALPRPAQAILSTIVPTGLGRTLVNAMTRRDATRDPLIAWGLQQGMEVMGAKDPFDFIRATLQFRTLKHSHRLDQDVLLMAGTTDHYVPLQHFWAQARALTHTRSVTGRIFTEAESASNHCQLGNLGLAIRTMLDWLSQLEVRVVRS
ncbi:MAG: alpha/beta fold hydrolase [Propionibacteriaceae bacterium]|nr:alpha/beta fold hydrolase [Propionibacteriaceae bacterium]